MAFFSINELIEEAEKKDLELWQVVRDLDMEQRQVTEEQSWNKMLQSWQAMLESVDHYAAERRSVSGMIGGDASKMEAFSATGKALLGGYMQEVLATALKVAESNACMCKIVAAPTAGACGVLPAVLVPLYKRGLATEEEMIKTLFVAAGIGIVIGYRACIAGASGGCQAEIGSASAMAAGALVYLRGGSNEAVGHAVAMALKNLMGLICDPIAGLVEVPCVKRNVIGASNAVSCADMAMAGITSRVPVDEVIDCMGVVGSKMPFEFKETALGGLAATPFGNMIKEKMQVKKS